MGALFIPLSARKQHKPRRHLLVKHLRVKQRVYHWAVDGKCGAGDEKHTLPATHTDLRYVQSYSVTSCALSRRSKGGVLSWWSMELF
jgi:hypothetical protein